LSLMHEYPPDILITDIRMPNMDGVELTKETLSFYPDVVVIAITGYSDIDTAVEIMKYGAMDFLQKPVKIAEMQMAIKSAADRWQLRRDLRLANESLQQKNTELFHEIIEHKKTEEKLISGIDCNPNYAIDEMKATKAVWNKTEGRQYKHFVQSFSPEEQITPEQAHKIAFELAQNEFKGFEVLIATHKDSNHIHSHIIVNSVSHENGNKFQQSKNELQQMKDHSDELCALYDLSICEKSDKTATYSIGKYKAIERASKGEYKSYVFDTALAVDNAMLTATSRESFISSMKGQGYETEWSDNKKYITFTDKDGNKVRNSNLEKTFKIDCSKESLENGFCKIKGERNTQIEGAEQSKQPFITGGATTEQQSGRASGSEQQYRVKISDTTGAEPTEHNNRTDINGNRKAVYKTNERVGISVDESGKSTAQTDIGQLFNKLSEIRGINRKYNPDEQRRIADANRRAEQQARELSAKLDEQQRASERSYNRDEPELQ